MIPDEAYALVGGWGCALLIALIVWRRERKRSKAFEEQLRKMRKCPWHDDNLGAYCNEDFGEDNIRIDAEHSQMVATVGDQVRTFDVDYCPYCGDRIRKEDGQSDDPV